MTILINLFGASSAGKSSLMADLFTAIKQMGITVEMCPEVVKQWAWDGIFPNKYDQYYLLGQEIKQQSRLFGKVEIAISDSPVMQNAFYNWYLNDRDNLFDPSLEYQKMAEEDKHLFLNFMLIRNKPFETKGRYQTEEESNIISHKLIQYLETRNVKYDLVPGKDKERVDFIVETVAEILEKKMRSTT